MFSFLLMKIDHCSTVSILPDHLDIMHLPCYHCQVTYNINCAFPAFTNSLPWPYGIAISRMHMTETLGSQTYCSFLQVDMPTHLHKLFSSAQAKFGQTSRKKKLGAFSHPENCQNQTKRWAINDWERHTLSCKSSMKLTIVIKFLHRLHSQIL